MGTSPFSYSPGTVQTFQAGPSGGTYVITAIGASGGGGTSSNGGYGAVVRGTFTLAPSEVLDIVVGGEGFYSNGSPGGGGGGGGSFVFAVVNGSNIRLEIAGGGGGGGNSANGSNAPTSYATGIGANAAGGAPGSGFGAGGGGGYGGGQGSPNSSTVATSGYSRTGGYGGGAGSYIGGYGGGGGGGYAGGGGGGGFTGGAGGAGAGTSGPYGGGGGGSYDGGTNPAVQDAASAGNGEVVITPLCFLRGTHILTPTGEVLVEDLRSGDTVVTRFGGMQPVKWIGRHSHAATAARQNPALRPVRIAAGALGERLPARDLFVSPGHSVLVDGTLLIARLLVNGVTVTQDRCPPSIDYFHIELDAHDCVIAEGAWAETYADAQRSRERFDNAAEFDALYPDAGPAPDAFTLCAPRPEAGEALATAMASVVARAAAQVSALRLVA